MKLGTNANVENGKRFIAKQWGDKRVRYGAIAGVAALVVTGSFILTGIVGGGVAYYVNQKK